MRGSFVLCLFGFFNKLNSKQVKNFNTVQFL
jgi:hypothetical protein